MADPGFSWGRQLQNVCDFAHFLLKMKEFLSPWGWVGVPGTPLDLPMSKNPVIKGNKLLEKFEIQNRIFAGFSFTKSKSLPRTTEQAACLTLFTMHPLYHFWILMRKYDSAISTANIYSFTHIYLNDLKYKPKPLQNFLPPSGNKWTCDHVA